MSTNEMKNIMSKFLLDHILLEGCDHINPRSFSQLSSQETSKDILLAQRRLNGSYNKGRLKGNIEYVEASPLNLEYDSLEMVNEIQVVKLFDLVEFFKSKTSLIRFFLIWIILYPNSRLLAIYRHETRSGSTTTHANNSLPEYDSFLFEVEPDQGGLISIVISNNSNNPLLELPEFESFHFDPSFPRPPPEPPDVEISLIIETDAPVINNFDELNEDECFDPGGDEINVEDDDSFIFVIRTFLPFLTYPVDSPFLCSFKNEDTILTPASPLRAGGISSGWNFHVRILQKSQENGQNRTNTDTGKEKEYKSRENAIKGNSSDKEHVGKVKRHPKHAIGPNPKGRPRG
ncbi:hypothetical protein Tco_0615414 [Tanacetum coccineum]